MEKLTSAPADSKFFLVGFCDLDDATKRARYQEANETHDVNLVRELNKRGMKPVVPSFSGPSIVSIFMDIATKHKIILGFLKGLRDSGRFMTQSEFKDLRCKRWVKKSSLGRIMGCDHIMKKVRDFGLKHIKTPLKVAVVRGDGPLKVSGYCYPPNLYDFYSDQTKVYAERIESVERKISREEIDELIQVIDATNFLDMWPSNIVVSEDSIYFIDTEFKSFAGTITWGKMGRFVSLVGEEDQEYFRERIQKKMEEPLETETEYGYDNLTCLLETVEGLSPEQKEKHKDWIQKLKNKCSDLEYVGAKKAGSSWISPNEFLFDLEEIMS